MLDVMNDGVSMTHAFALFLAFMVTIAISIGIVCLIFYFGGMWKLYKKLGLKGWYVFIPFYNKWVLFEKLGLEWYWFIVYHLPIFFFFLDKQTMGLTYIAMALASLVCIYNIARRFNKSNSWIVITFVFAEIVLPILGWSKDELPDESVVLSPNGFIGEKKTTTIGSKVKKVSKKIEKVVKEKKATKKEDK